ncbi:MAG: hypothetical protein MN733_40300, partial [Nitrososphaera sp.]|nr:hypothetical protein [Nitrososphaera sp.]
EIAVRLLRQIKDAGVFDKFNEIYFIAHSMGGLVAKRILVDLTRQTQIEKLRKVKAVLFISTPAQGVSMAQWGSLLSFNPQVRDMELADFNSYLQSIENQWQNLLRDRGTQLFPKSFCAYETKPTHGVVTVSRVSAATFFDDDPFPVDENHPNIAKPSSAESNIYLWAQARLLETSLLAESELQPSISLQLAPRVLHYVHRYKTDGVTMHQNEYGFGVIVRARNNGKKIERLRALEITGDIAALPDDYSAFKAEGRTIEDLDAEYKRRQPYYRVSFVYFPVNVSKIEPESEEFIKFMPLDPTSLTTRVIVRGDDPPKYVGFGGENPVPPVFLTTVPNIFSFVTFTGSEHKVPGNAHLLGPRLRGEIKSGKLKFILKFESGSHIVNPHGIPNPALISLESWNKEIPQDIFFKNNFWDRAEPVKKDPLVETLP